MYLSFSEPGITKAEYLFVVAGDVSKSDALGATVDDHDEIHDDIVDGLAVVTGHVYGGTDTFHYDGHLLGFQCDRLMVAHLPDSAVESHDDEVGR